jgi:hypothetical protein
MLPVFAKPSLRLGVTLHWTCSPCVTCWSLIEILPTCFTFSASPGCWASLTASNVLDAWEYFLEVGPQCTFLEVFEAILQPLSDACWSATDPSAAAAVTVKPRGIRTPSTSIDPDAQSVAFEDEVRIQRDRDSEDGPGGDFYVAGGRASLLHRVAVDVLLKSLAVHFDFHDDAWNVLGDDHGGDLYAELCNASEKESFK